MNFLLHCVMARQGHSVRAVLNVSNSAMFWVVTKFTVYFCCDTKDLPVISVEPVLPTLLHGLTVLQALLFLSGSLMLTLCCRNVLFPAPHNALLFPQREGPLFSSRFLLTQSKRIKEASIVLPSEKNLAYVITWFP